VTCNPDFKFTPLFDVEYLGNGARYIAQYNKGYIVSNFSGVLIGIHALFKGALFWSQLRMTSSDLMKYSVARSIARSLCLVDTGELVLIVVVNYK